MPDVPVLVISGELDANTPTSAGRAAARQFAHATLAEIPNVGHVPTDASPCGLQLGLRFVATTTADPDACAGTGTPPPVAPTAPLRVAELAPVDAPGGSLSERRALAVVVATATDLQQQSGLRTAFGTATGRRGGRYVGRGARVRLAAVRVVRGATVDGRLVVGERRIAGTLRLRGPGIANGRLHIRLAATGRGRAAGSLDRRPVRLAFRFGG
jgi:hypothetical protein